MNNGRLSVDSAFFSRLPLWGAEGTGAGVHDSPAGCQSRAVTESWVAGSAGSAAAGETGD